MGNGPKNPVHFSPQPSEITDKMSSTNVSTVLAQLLSEVKSMNGRLSTLEGLVSAKPSGSAAASGKPSEAASGAKKAKKERDPAAPKRAPSAWVLFTGRVRSVLAGAGFEKKDLGVDTIMFSSSLKEENAKLDSWSDADILARRAAWVKPEVSKKKASAAPSVVLEDGEVEDEAPAAAKKERKNPWAGLSEEQKAERVAKMKAGKAAKKAAEAPSEEEAPPSDGEAAPSVTSSEKKKRGPKKFSEMTPEELEAAKAKRAAKKSAKSSEAPKSSAAPALPALPPSPKSSVGSPLDGFQRVMLSGEPYWVNLASGHCYRRLSDGGQGEWAGIFHRTPKPHIDDSMPEPSDDEGFVLEEA
jgi:hypothetical protein